MEEFDSGWDETPSSLDSENVCSMNNYEHGDTINGYEPSILQQQMLEMRDDPAMSFHVPNSANNSLSRQKETTSTDCTSLSSEIFLATRLLHDETLDSTTLTSTMAESQSSSYNENPNFNNFSPLENEIPQDTIDSIGLSQTEALDSDFLYNNFERLNSERQDLSYDEGSNKSWEESMPPSTKILPALLGVDFRKKTIVRTQKGERKKRIIKKKSTIAMDNSGTNSSETNHSSSLLSTLLGHKTDKPIVKEKTNITTDDTKEYVNKPNNSNNLLGSLLGHNSDKSEIRINPSITLVKTEKDINKTTFSSSMLASLLQENIKKSISKPRIDSQKNINAGIGDEYLIPSTSTSVGANVNVFTRDGRKLPSYLKLYKLRDKEYSEIYACKNCYGIFTTLDSAIFHPCLKKRRGRRPKILQDCVVPL